ncbi:MAG: hypothetical protein HQL84_09945 [Magnetococcales bacterium]|nr:hypothetical protein [Magnetococcales bacterium]MBF0150352.1 hypothetical protein [Magnetococcales bacterium]MBF0632146.1 hypothetical protein [Magnetococcales bacterium]
MSTNVTTRIVDWGDMVALAEDGHTPPATAYEFSNGRKFSQRQRSPHPRTPKMMEPEWNTPRVPGEPS